MGSKADTEMPPSAINVLNFVDLIDEDIPGFRHQYDRLSEFAHPNWAGTAFLFSKIDYSTAIAEFGENTRGTESTRRIGLANLSAALAIFEVSYNRITDLMLDFVQLCELHTTDAGARGRFSRHVEPSEGGRPSFSTKSFGTPLRKS